MPDPTPRDLPVTGATVLDLYRTDGHIEAAIARPARPGDVRMVVVGGSPGVDGGGSALVDLGDAPVRAGAALESDGARA